MAAARQTGDPKVGAGAPKIGAGGVYIVSDHREKHVHDFLDEAAGAAGINHIRSQLVVGDYLVCRRDSADEEPRVLAVVERKTLPDFAASFRDGRYDNINKMLDLRNRVGCQVYFFVEGPAFPEPTWRVSRIPYRNILSAMTLMMVRSGVLVVQTRDTNHTAQRLVEFAAAFAQTPTPYEYPTSAPEPVDAGGEAAGAGGAADADGAADAGRIPGLVPAEALVPVAKSSHDLVVQVWARLHGVSVTTAGVLVRSFSVSDLVSGQISEAELAALRTPTNRAFPKKALVTLRAARTAWTRDAEIRLLSGVPGVSPAMAAEVLAGTTLRALLGRGPEAVAAREISQKGRRVRFGLARAERAVRLLTYVHKPAPAQDGEVGVAGLADAADAGLADAAYVQDAIATQISVADLVASPLRLDDDELAAMLADFAE